MQQIHINRNRINSIELDVPEITVPLKAGSECSFELVIINYGSPTHVHLSTSDSLRSYVKFLHNNPYVANQEWIPVVVKLPPDITRAEGEIKVTTGYGSHTKTFKMFIGARPAESRPKFIIDVDERLGIPRYQRKPISVGPAEDVDETYHEEEETKTSIFENFVIPLILILLVMVILLITFIFEKINVIYGAVAVSSIIIILMIYTAMHLLTTK